MLMACPLNVSAQDDIDDEEDDVPQVVVRKVRKAQKKYNTRIISGTVLDAATGKPLTGVIVKTQGIEGYSALTDDKGNYLMYVPHFASALYISTPSYNPVVIGLSQDEKQRTARLLNSSLTSEYTEATNVINVASTSDYKYSNALNIKEEIEKQLGAYAYTRQRSGTPGIGSNIFIQGLNTLNSNAQPLVVIDGAIVDQQYGREMLHNGFVNDILTNINPADIENVSIIRNGTALYGARGANGVIEIRTHRSASLATRITANISAGVTTEPKYYEMMDAEQYRNYSSTLLKTVNTQRNEFKFLNADPNYYYYNQYHNNTDWKKLLYHSAATQNYGINVEGGDDVAQYNLSVGYTLAKSSMKCNDMSRLNIRFNTDVQITNELSVRFDASFSNLTRDIRDDGAPTTYDEGTPTSPSFLGYAKAPFLSPYSYGAGKISDSYLDTTDETYLDEALSLYKNYNYKLGNPLAFNEYGEAENKNHFENSLLNIAVTPKYQFNDHLTLSEHFCYNLVNTNNKYYLPVNGVPTFYVASVSADRENLVSSLATKQNSIQSDTRLTWNNRYDAHDIALFGGVRINSENYTRSKQLGYNTGSDKTPFMSADLLNRQSTGVDESWNNMDMYIQGNYDYLGRYFAQVNLTASGSSRFGKDAIGGLKMLGTVWALFPSVQASWVITNEPWFAKTPGIDYLRLTAGFDMSGNDDIDVFAAKSHFASSLFLNDITGLTFSEIGNTAIKWETTRRFNVGFEGNFLGNRLHVGFNYFKSATTGLLALQELGFISGIESNWANSGKLANNGYDANVRGKIIATKDWGWELGASVGHYKNKITSLGLSNGQTWYTTDINGATILTQEGSPANLFYGYRTKGVFSTTKEAMDSRLYVLDANGVKKNYFEAGDMIFDNVYSEDDEINENDRVVIGDPNPDIYGNIFTALTWKNLKLDVNLAYSLGNDVYNYMRQQLESGSRFLNQTTTMTQRWMAEGDVTTMPKATFQDPMQNSRFSDRWIEDGSYLKLKSITLSYDLPLNSTFLQGLQFWIQANNVFTLTKYLGTDPEFSSTTSVIGQGIDLGYVGQSRSFMAGVKINL